MPTPQLLRMAIERGKLHGVTSTQGPTGSRVTMKRLAPSPVVV